ncbi:helix-turn-helix domain-containing protein [Aggregatilinea lenta]|uniref:helix-turn-helix domain-containing protein n=1 Tax=Aggregatilinea lenta TaxID=913108 RepID=UPI000E5AACAF|nr:helix-turn-helix domain-containing protein [Aggregatilinea lenta]
MPKHHTERPPVEPLRIYSREEVAEILNVSLSTVKRLLASGQLRSSQPEGLRRVFITGQAILDLLASSESPPDPAPDKRKTHGGRS